MKWARVQTRHLTSLKQAHRIVTATMETRKKNHKIRLLDTNKETQRTVTKLFFFFFFFASKPRGSEAKSLVLGSGEDIKKGCREDPPRTTQAHGKPRCVQAALTSAARRITLLQQRQLRASSSRACALRLRAAPTATGTADAARRGLTRNVIPHAHARTRTKTQTRGVCGAAGARRARPRHWRNALTRCHLLARGFEDFPRGALGGDNGGANRLVVSVWCGSLTSLESEEPRSGRSCVASWGGCWRHTRSEI